MFVAYAEGYSVDLEAGHPFPMAKYRLVYEQLLREGTINPSQLLAPSPLEEELILLAHTPDYLNKLLNGALSPQEEYRLGFRWFPALARRARLAAKGTLLAAQAALEQGIGVNLAGGSHHAFPDHGEGYCMLNDLAITTRVLQKEGRAKRIAILDCDVHQGNGTAAILGHDPDVLTFSIHSENNYPFQKIPGTMDVGLPDGTDDETYLDILAPYVHRILDEFQPDLVLYVAGVDPYEGDRLGRLKLSFEGLKRRDAYVLGHCQGRGVPVVITLAGGYATHLHDTVQAHCNTVRTARQVFG